MLVDSHFLKEADIAAEDGFWGLPTVVVADQGGDSLDDGGIRIGPEKAPAVAVFRNQPELGLAPLDAKGLKPKGLGQGLMILAVGPILLALLEMEKRIVSAMRAPRSGEGTA